MTERKHYELVENSARKQTAGMPWRAGRGKRLRLHLTEALLDLEAAMPLGESSSDEVAAVTEARLAVMDALEKVARLARWGW